MKKKLAAVLCFIACGAMCLSLCSCAVKVESGDWSYMEGVWYKKGDVQSAFVTFSADTWASVSSDGESIGNGTYTIINGDELMMYDENGEYVVMLVLRDKNTFTLGDSGTEYIRGSSIK